MDVSGEYHPEWGNPITKEVTLYLILAKRPRSSGTLNNQNHTWFCNLSTRSKKIRSLRWPSIHSEFKANLRYETLSQKKKKKKIIWQAEKMAQWLSYLPCVRTGVWIWRTTPVSKYLWETGTKQQLTLALPIPLNCDQKQESVKQSHCEEWGLVHSIWHCKYWVFRTNRSYAYWTRTGTDGLVTRTHIKPWMGWKQGIPKVAD